ncbi:MAG: NACHT C-terminal helical domain 2-containing protein [Nostoc sp. ZfuVER08]|jgi:hypothetical protein|uniref:NACHT conflict system C-terminal helical domain-containing protein n=1 Tax=Nostoc punctiforme FACHB-252 TaxID=1357509 RepID=A0ABR8H9R9_NOSPU|nr:hypothetical protein [Nostoc punctiforme]MBD2612557.1 hypothetical protein [Nostoc punctiforme FACHB-252]MDZ8012706.1 hypothetical protein [Nostoc sp. ZfuVER08]
MYANEINENGESITPAWFNLPGSNFATLLGDFRLTLLLSHDISICFDFGFISYCPSEEAFGDVCNLSQINIEDDFGIDMILTNLLVILKSFTTDYAELSSKDVYSKALSTIIKAMNILYKTNLENELRDLFGIILCEINAIKNSKKKFQKWFQIHGQKKTKELRNLLEKCRGIQFNWDFTKDQLELLIEYYTANILLLECLNINNAVNDEFKQDIKKVLLLPIAEIEKRKRETGK